MMTRFLILLTLSVKHAYYGAGSDDFDFLLPAETARLLGNGRVIPRVKDKFYLLFEADEAAAPLAPIAGKTIRIGMKLRNPNFAHFTAGDPLRAFALYRNGAGPDQLDPVERAVLTGPLFSHPLAGPARPVTVTLEEGAGGALRSEVVTAAEGRSSVSYDLTGQAGGLYIVQEAYSGASASARYYVDPELKRLGAFGAVEIGIDENFYAAPPGFEISFDAKEEQLKYYVVARNYTDAEFNQLSISDAGFADEGRPQLNFTKVASGAFGADDIPPELLGGGNAKVVLFKSQTAAPRREKPRKKIQLKKNGDVLIPHLPQPGAGRGNSELIIQISKP